MKRFLLCTLVVFLLFSTTGCFSRPRPYETLYGVDQVQKVEICRYDKETKSLTVILELASQDIPALFADIAELEHEPEGVPPWLTTGPIILYITYKNGEAELIGSSEVVTVRADGSWKFEDKVIGSDEFYPMLVKYVDSKLIPESWEWLYANVSSTTKRFEKP